MSSAFSVYPQKIKRYKADLDSVQRKWGSCNNRMISGMNNLGSYSGFVNIRRRLSDIYNDSNQNADVMLRYIRAIEQITDKYESTERRICDGATADGARKETPNPVEKDTAGDIMPEDSWWEQFKEGMGLAWNITEQQIIDMPEWLRYLLMITPGTQIIGYLPYILENDYLRTACWQAIAGDFTEDSNILGTALSVIIGFIPIVGQIADVRDLIADIYNLIDDGPETSEWIDLGFTAIGLLPGLGDFLKHTDEVGDILKHADDAGDILKHADDITDVAKHGNKITDLFKQAGDFISNASEQVENFKQVFDEEVVKRITDPIKKRLEKKLPGKYMDVWKDVMGRELSEGDTVADFLNELIREEINEATGIPTDLKELLKEIFAESDDADEQKSGAGENDSADLFPGIMRTMTGFVTVPF